MKLALATIPFALAGCMTTLEGVDPYEPEVSFFNGDTVKIVHHAFPVGNGADSPIVIKANQMCALKGKRATYGSFRKLPPYNGEHTYICV